LRGRAEYHIAGFFIIYCSFCIKKKTVATLRKQARVVASRKHSKLTIRVIGEQLGNAKSTVGRIAMMTESGNDVNIHRRGRCGRKRKTIASEDKMIIRNSVKAPSKTCRELQST